MDGSGNVYVADSNNRRVQVFDSFGNFITKWGSTGTGDGQFLFPWGIAVDGSGNVYVGDQYSVQVFEGEAVADITPPVISQPADLTYESSSASGVFVAYAIPSATDDTDPSPYVTCSPPSGTFAIGTTTVTCTATDSYGNSSHASFNVTIEDTTPPAITVSGNITTEATSAAGAMVSYSAPTATDSVDAAPSLSCSAASGSTFALGTTTVTCTAIDTAALNSSSGSFDVTVQDTTAPAIVVSGNITAEATSAAGAVVSYSAPTATDSVDASPSLSCSTASGSTFALGITTVTCTATDTAALNSSSGSFDVTVQDTTAPAIVVSGNITAEATSAGWCGGFLQRTYRNGQR